MSKLTTFPVISSQTDIRRISAMGILHRLRTGLKSVTRSGTQRVFAVFQRLPDGPNSLFGVNRKGVIAM